MRRKPIIKETRVVFRATIAEKESFFKFCAEQRLVPSDHLRNFIKTVGKASRVCQTDNSVCGLAGCPECPFVRSRSKPAPAYCYLNDKVMGGTGEDAIPS